MTLTCWHTCESSCWWHRMEWAPLWGGGWVEPLAWQQVAPHTCRQDQRSILTTPTLIQHTRQTRQWWPTGRTGKCTAQTHTTSNWRPGLLDTGKTSDNGGSVTIKTLFTCFNYKYDNDTVSRLELSTSLPHTLSYCKLLPLMFLNKEAKRMNGIPVATLVLLAAVLTNSEGPSLYTTRTS